MTLKYISLYSCKWLDYENEFERIKKKVLALPSETIKTIHSAMITTSFDQYKMNELTMKLTIIK